MEESVINSSFSESSSSNEHFQTTSKPAPVVVTLQVPEVLSLKKEGKASDSSSKNFKNRSHDKTSKLHTSQKSKKKAVDTLSSESLPPPAEGAEKGKGRDTPGGGDVDGGDVGVGGDVSVGVSVDVDGGDVSVGGDVGVDVHVGVDVGGVVGVRRYGGEEDKLEQFEGWIWKKAAGLGSQFDKRWFLLTTEKKLRYFENEEKAKELGVVDLCQATRLTKALINHERTDRPGFTFSSKSRTWKLFSDTEEERDIWFEKICYMMKSIEHHSDNYLSRLLLGIKVALRGEPNRKLEIDFLDYNLSTIHRIMHPNGLKLDFQEFSPFVFAKIREMNGYSQISLLTEWDLSEEKISSTGSSGKSGSIFVLSSDHTFMVKSIEKREERLLLRMVHDYHQHLIKYPDTLLMKVLAFYSLKSTISTTPFIMFNNLLKLTVSINEKYDIKGSTKDREASRIELQKTIPCLLDNDFINSKRKLHFSPEIKKLFMEQLTADTLLLSRFDAMDYSLLIAVHKITDKDQEILSTLSSQMFYNSPLGQGVCTVLSSDKQEIYFIGIIDIFTFYDTEKKVAHAAKAVKFSPDSLSTVNAQRYCKRFCAFVDSIIE